MTKPAPGSTVTFDVSAFDPDSEPITSLVMVEKKMPPNSGATFIVNATHTGGTFTWPTRSFTGNFSVDFIATNALVGSARANIQIKTKGRLAAERATEESVTERALSGAFPNPSPGAVEFALDLPRDSRVRWAIYDLQDRVVWSEERVIAAGHRSLRWDGTLSYGGKAPTGVYLVRASVDGTQFARRVVHF